MTFGTELKERDNICHAVSSLQEFFLHVRKDLLNSFVNDGLISSPHSIKKRPGMPSGPLALFTFKVFNWCSSSVRVTSNDGISVRGTMVELLFSDGLVCKEGICILSENIY